MEHSILIGGKAGFGIDKSGLLIGSILNQLSYYVYIYRDYPSLIRGGHTFSIIRASEERIGTHKTKVDFILALNQDTLNFHKERLKDKSVLIYDSDSVKPDGLPSGIETFGVPINKLIKEEGAAEIMRNTCIIGAFCGAAAINWDALEAAFRKEIGAMIDLNLKVAKRGYGAAAVGAGPMSVCYGGSSQWELPPSKHAPSKGRLQGPPLPLLTGNQAIGLGLVKAGLKAYIAYPMTPSSPLLHFLAEKAGAFGLNVIHPESEIAVILMALGFSYVGQKAAVGTSGGGFCLMTEALSFAGQAELPVVIIVGQRPGPSTGLPTYSSQTDLHFVLNAGQGEFPRFIVAPGDAEEAYFWSAIALKISWKYQIPSIVLSDKNLGEGTFNFDASSMQDIKAEGPALWERKGQYKRYLRTATGVSPLAFAPDKGAVIKINSYEHDEYGITTEDPAITAAMQDKRLGKVKYLLKELETYQTIGVYGNKNSSTAVLCWGSNKAVCCEAAQSLGLRVIQPLVLSPFPVAQFKEALVGVKRLICVENNATGQLVRLIKGYGFDVDETILKYDGRPFAVDELEEELSRIVIPVPAKAGKAGI